MNEKTNKKNKIYLVSIKLIELVFITKAKNKNRTVLNWIWVNG